MRRVGHLAQILADAGIVVLAYFMSSAEDELSQSHTNGKDFEAAAQT